VPLALRLGKYIVEGLLGPGGVTETYLAHLAPDVQDESSRHLAGKVFALKLLRADRIAEGDFGKIARRFLLAGRQLRDFHRPGFGKVVDLSEDPAATFLVTEHVAGTDLAGLVDQGQGGRAEGSTFDPVLAGLIGSEIARILHVGHSAKPSLCHLGLAPHNVMLTEAGEVVLLDAGIACSLRAVTEQPPERWFFVAPEMQGVDAGAAGLSDRQGVAADLYSLGALVHFLVTGSAPPLAGAPAPQAREARTSLADLPGVSSNLGAALRTLLSSEYEDRPESAAVLVDWLASGVDAARDRRQFIAEGLRAAEKGWTRASEALPAIASIAPIASIEAPPPREPPPIKTPGPASGKADGVRVAQAHVVAAPSRRRGIAASVALAVVLAVVGVGAMAALGRWPGRKQTSHVRDRNQGRSTSTEMRSAPSNAAGEPSPAEADEAPQAPEPTLGESVLARVAGHLIVETVPPGAVVWVDGVIKGKSFADIMVGEGGHRIVLIAPGHRMFRDVVDTSHGTILRRTLVPVDPPTRGNGFLDVDCRTVGKFPILLDEEETGLLCPAKLVPAKPGKHVVGIFVPQERRTVAVETTVEAGAKPSSVKFSD
jgi:serine/threonine protein kinase